MTVRYLTFPVNLSIDKGEFPKELKKGKLKSMHENVSELDGNNYRTNIITKCMQQNIYVTLPILNSDSSYDIWSKKFSLLYCKQFGFCAKYS